MQTFFKSLLIAAAFVLIGVGCTPNQSGISDLPTTPPEDATRVTDVMEKDDDTMMKDEAMMEKDDGAMEKENEAMEKEDAVMEKKDDAMMEKDDTAMEKDDGAMEKEEEKAYDDTAQQKILKPYYIAHTDEVAAQAFAEGRPVMYYFWAAWCPICRAEEPDIKRWVETSEHPVAGFRVNFDTQKDLTSQHKVPFQHTTVFLNKDGVEVERFTGPTSEEAYRAAFAKAAQ